MITSSPILPILIFGYGNPSRGDDALGPMILERISKRDNVELLTDFQLQVEHSLDMMGRKLILFIDASITCSTPFEFHQLETDAPKSSPSYTTHELTPNELLKAYLDVHHEAAPSSYLLSIHGEQFELGASLSSGAQQNLQLATQWVEKLLEHPSISEWQRLFKESIALAA